LYVCWYTTIIACNLYDIILVCMLLMWFLFWLGEKCGIYKLSELHDKVGEECIVIGTLFKHQELKPSILKEISEEVI